MTPKQEAKQMFNNTTNQMWETGNPISKQDVKDRCVENIDLLLNSNNKHLDQIRDYWGKVKEEIIKL